MLGRGGTFITYIFVFALRCAHSCLLATGFFAGGGGGGGGILVSGRISGQDIGICIVCFGLLCSCVCVFVF